MADTRKTLSIIVVGNQDKKADFLRNAVGERYRDYNSVELDDETTVSIMDTQSSLKFLAASNFKYVEKIVVICPIEGIEFGKEFDDKVVPFRFGVDEAKSFIKELVDKKYPQAKIKAPKIKKPEPVITQEANEKEKQEPIQETKVEKQKPVITQETKVEEKKESVETKETNAAKKKKPSLFDDFKRFVHNVGGQPKPPPGGPTIN